MKEHSRLDVRKLLFLPDDHQCMESTDCVHASRINMFKNRIDKYIVGAVYTMWTLDKQMASLSAGISGVPWMAILLNLVKYIQRHK